MLKSMTGYGAASYSKEGLTINVEVKTLNSKFLDLNLRLPKSFNEQEITIRNLANDILERGKVSMTVDYVDETELDIKQSYNQGLFKKYYEELKSLADQVGASEQELFKIALSAPDVVNSVGDSGIEAANWDKVKEVITNALNACDQFRMKEGAELMQKFEGYIETIASHLKSVEELDPKRVERVKSRIEGNLLSFVDEEGLDKNRLEQEIIYYIEKLDITEEKVRLANHLDHFTEVLRADQSYGKKLGFISQEIGREINTIGSKANDSDIQKHVVAMKESLEKIKEQVLNVL